MSSFSVATLQEKLSRLSASQESIETLSLWIIHHKTFAKTSVAVWADSFGKADPDHRLVLLYLTNDILQNGRRKGADMFNDLFREHLEQVVPSICGQKIQSSVERMFRIWRDRKVYDKEFVKCLDQLLAGQQEEKSETNQVPTVDMTTPPPEALPDFQLSLLEDAVMELRKFQGEMRIKEASVEALPMEVWDTSSLELLKDKSEGNEFSVKFDKACATLKDYSDCLGIEVSERVSLSQMLVSCLAQQTRELTRVQQDLKVYKTLTTQLRSCREKRSARQKDLERAQQTATSDPTCKEDLTEVGDMEIDSEEESMETQPQAQQPTPSLPTLATTVHTRPNVFNSRDMAPAEMVLLPNAATTPPVPPQMNSLLGHTLPQGINTTPRMMLPTSQSVTDSQPYSSPMPGFHPHPPHPQRFSRAAFGPPPLPSMMHVSPQQQRMQTRPSAPPLGMQLRYPFRGPPPIRGQIGPPQQSGNMGQRPPPMQFPNSRPLGPPQQSNIRPLGGPGGPERGREEPVETAGVKSSLDDRLQSLVVRNSLGSVLLQEYAESDDSTGDKPYTPTTTPLPASPSGGDGDDESVTTPTPQLDMSPINSEETGTPQFNPSNPIMKALYHSPTHSPEEGAPAEVGVASGQPAGGSGEEGGILSGVDTGMLQNILKNVHGLAQTPPPVSTPTAPTLSTKPPESVLPPLQAPPSTTPPAVTPTLPTGEKTATTPTSAARGGTAPNIKITSSLTTLLDEIFPQLSKSLQERKRKPDPSDTDSPGKQPRIESGGQPLTPGGPDIMRPPGPVRPNGPRPPNGGFSPRGPPRLMGPGRPPGLILRPVGPRPHPEGGMRPPGPGMILRLVGPRPPHEGGLRPRGPPFDGHFRPRGPPRPDGHFRLIGPPRPGMQLVGECPRPLFRPQNMNSGPPLRQPFPPHSSFQPRGPPVSNQNFSQLPFGPRPMQPSPVRLVDTGMDPSYFPEKPPQSSRDALPPPPQGMWP